MIPPRECAAKMMRTLGMVPDPWQRLGPHRGPRQPHSLLAYELPDGRLKLIDGHLRRDIDSDMEVEVEVLDVSEEEARTLLMSIDPLAALAETQEQLRQRLGELVPEVPEDLRLAWEATALAAIDSPREPSRRAKTTIREQFAIIVTCRDEPHQVELLMRLHAEGLDCLALLS
jgi:hypothetical protein